MSENSILLLVALLLYFLPVFVAEFRLHRNLVPIAIVNLFLGWTVVGWIVALAWAASADGKGREGVR